MNLSSYVHVQEYAVCPHNLIGFSECYRSALKDIHVLDQIRYHDIMIGPFGLFYDPSETFRKYNLNCELTDRTLFISGIMTTRDFLQRIFVISYLITKNQSLGKISDDQVNKIIELSKGWFNTDSKIKFNNEIVDMETGEKTDRKETKHDIRHNIIVDNFPNNPKKVIDLGCGNGLLSKKIKKSYPDIDIVGIDRNTNAIYSLRKKIKNGKFIIGDLLYPNFDTDDFYADILLLSEVIEHFELKDRQRIVRLLKELFIVNTIFISVPNIEYNKKMGWDGYRDSDHKTEYTLEQLYDEIINPLKSVYNFTFLPMDDAVSFIIKGECFVKDRTPNKNIIRDIKSLYNAEYLPISEYRVTENELEEGYAHCSLDTPFVAGTISPSEGHDEYIEHPTECFDYYRERGVRYLYEEYKKMGSHAYVLVFKSKDIANKLGYDLPIDIRSKSGLPFFKDTQTLMDIWKEFDIVCKYSENINKYDWIFFQAEILPWGLKGNKQTEKQFLIPAECCKIHKQFTNSDLKNISEFMKCYDKYTNAKFEVCLFNVLSCGTIKNNKLNKAFNGFYVERSIIYDILNSYNGDIVNSDIGKRIVNLYDDESMSDSIRRWIHYTEREHQEGFVYKLPVAMTFDKNGYLLQPMMKVRGKEYLRLIYGIDYTNYIDFIKNRSTKKKRIQAIQELELSNYILQAFLSGNNTRRRKLIAAFFGSKSVNFSNVDATL